MPQGPMLNSMKEKHIVIIAEKREFKVTNPKYRRDISIPIGLRPDGKGHY